MDTITPDLNSASAPDPTPTPDLELIPVLTAEPIPAPTSAPDPATDVAAIAQAAKRVIKNLQYRNILYNTTTPSRLSTATEAEIDTYITDAIQTLTTAKLPWNKLQKTVKIEKLIQFAERVAVEKKYTGDETKKLIAFFKNCLDNKQLQRIKDVHYDAEKGVIINIPILLYNKTTQRYTLKNTDKHAVTHKSTSATKQLVEPVQLNSTPK